MNNSDISLSQASEKDKDTIQNLGCFYVYEMSRYCGFLSGWEVPENGLFECIDLSSYCEKPDRHAFLIRANDDHLWRLLLLKAQAQADALILSGEFFCLSQEKGAEIL